jgi:tetratricopeptide (TPR) repeat protein
MRLRFSVFSRVSRSVSAKMFCMGKAAGFFLALMCLVTLRVFGEDDSVIRHQAASDISAHQFAKAVATLAPLLREHPQDPSLWTLRGLALEGLGQTRESLVSFDRALRVDGRYVPALEGAAQTAYTHGDPKAMHYLQLLLQLAPGNPTANAMAGALAYEAHNCDEALRYFTASGEAVYQSANALGEFADCLLKTDQLAHAERVLSQGLPLHPDNIQLKYNLAVAELRNRQPDQAVALLSPLATVQDSGLLNLLASAYVQVNRPDDAFRTLEEAIRISPKVESNYLDLSILCLDHYQEQRSVQAATAGIARIPRAASLYLIRGVAYAQLGQYDKAEADFKAAARIQPDQPHSAIAMSFLYSDRQQVDKEKQLLLNQLKTTPEDAVTNYLYADLLIRLGAEPGQAAFELAKKHLALSLRSRPDSVEAQVLMGRILEQENDPTGALGHFERALTVDPDNQAALNQELLVLRKLHRYDEAGKVIEHLKSVLSKGLQQGMRATRVQTDTQAR